ncbi:MAG: hypothetical protein CVV64_18605 [Candidatus Wallbacteria bacterium HGW-Wallbacteria-1]|uniref:Uncharacterized protein n=1 Tax=Candidatus Wallbacteria bacterium HGW-Wallbacteria-1 TaxID=2013854 RepID=A0A2N1PJK3_9BACT|nr:MAG: hypothetical protein CVV64_18605 [Candidatus Wallbacteria bacterium HGW-Wallbacteria-1]
MISSITALKIVIQPIPKKSVSGKGIGKEVLDHLILDAGGDGGNLKIQSVQNYRKPRIPTIDEAILNPDLLSGNVPANWLKKDIVLSTLTAFLLFGSAVRAEEIAQETTFKSAGLAGSTQEVSSEIDVDHINSAEKSKVLVSPVFIYGDGRGATGCVVVSPPSFITESEARFIIEMELLKYGLCVDKHNYIIDSIDINGRGIIQKFDETKPTSIKLEVDGFDSKSNFAYIFVSLPDIDKYGFEDCYGSVMSYNLQTIAYHLRNAVEKKETINFAVFYDPLVAIENVFEENLLDFCSRTDPKLFREELRDEKFDFEAKKWSKFTKLNFTKDPFSDFVTLVEEAKKKRGKKAVELLKKQIEAFGKWFTENKEKPIRE